MGRKGGAAIFLAKAGGNVDVVGRSRTESSKTRANGKRRALSSISHAPELRQHQPFSPPEPISRVRALRTCSPPVSSMSDPNSTSSTNPAPEHHGLGDKIKETMTVMRDKLATGEDAGKEENARIGVEGSVKDRTTQEGMASAAALGYGAAAGGTTAPL